MTTPRRHARSRILFGVTAPNTALTFLSGQLGHLGDEGWDVHLACPDHDNGDVALMARHERATHHNVLLTRNPNPLDDLRSLLRVARIVRQLRPDVVVAGTPKMSLLLLLTSFLMRVPHRVYLCHGLRFEGYDGQRRRILAAMERILVALSTYTVAVSKSVRCGLLEIGVPAEKVVVLGPGSPNGVNLTRFSRPSTEETAAARDRFGLDLETPVAAFVGRLTRDKGIATLLHCAQELPQVEFLVAGAEEPSGSADAETIARLRQCSNVHLLGRVSDIEVVFRASDLLVLPTRREGMPTVVLEAAAAARPTVATRATGTVDAVVDGTTGVLVPAGDNAAFSDAISRMISDADLSRQMADAAEARAFTEFNPKEIWKAWSRFLRQISTSATQ